MRDGLRSPGERGTSKSVFAGFDDGAGVMGNQPQQSVAVLGVAQAAGAVEGVQARHGQTGRVAEVQTGIIGPRLGLSV